MKLVWSRPNLKNLWSLRTKLPMLTGYGSSPSSVASAQKEWCPAAAWVPALPMLCRPAQPNLLPLKPTGQSLNSPRLCAHLSHASEPTTEPPHHCKISWGGGRGVAMRQRLGEAGWLCSGRAWPRPCLCHSPAGQVSNLHHWHHKTETNTLPAWQSMQKALVSGESTKEFKCYNCSN